MRHGWIVSGCIFFAAGTAVGFLARETVAPPDFGALERTGDAEVKEVASEEQMRAVANSFRSLADAIRGRRRDADENDAGPGDREHRLNRSAAFAAVRQAVESGDRHAMHRALHELAHASGEPLSSAQLQELGALLDILDDDALEAWSRALVAAGGAEGLAVVMDFVTDDDASPRARERALHGLAHVPGEMRDSVSTAMADLLESGAGIRLQHTAAHVIGRLAGDESASALLGLLENRPGIRADVVFHALGDTAGVESTDTLMGLLSGDWKPRERMELLTAVGRIASRHDNADLLLDMMRTPPTGTSRAMIAEAIGRSSHNLGTGFLTEALLEVSGDRRAQERLAHALAENGGSAGLDVLRELVGDPGYDMSGRALARALERFRGGEAEPFIMDMLAHSRDEEVIQPLARNMMRNGSRESVSELMRLLREGNVSQRRAIAQTLSEGGSSVVKLDQLVDALKGERSRDVSSELARSIGRLYGDGGVQEIVGVFRNEKDTERRHALMWGLETSWRSSPQARELFMELAASDPSANIRRHAVEIMKRRHDRAILPALQGLLRAESHPDVRERIEKAIRDLQADGES